MDLDDKELYNFIDYSQVFLEMALQLRKEINEVKRVHPWLLEYATLGTLLDYVYYLYYNKKSDMIKLKLTTRKQRKETLEFTVEHMTLISTLHNVFQNVTHIAIDNETFTNFVVKYSHTTIG